jgi:hypothetical protein
MATIAGMCGRCYNNQNNESALVPTPEVRSEPPGDGYVYVMECAGFYKVGWSGAPSERLRQIQLCNPLPVQLVGHIKGSMDDETSWHKRFSSKRVRGEWFSLSPQDLETFLGEPVVGDPPKAPNLRRESVCDAPDCTVRFAQLPKGRPKRFCSPACRLRAHRKH